MENLWRESQKLWRKSQKFRFKHIIVVVTFFQIAVAILDNKNTHKFAYKVMTTPLIENISLMQAMLKLFVSLSHENNRN